MKKFLLATSLFFGCSSLAISSEPLVNPINDNITTTNIEITIKEQPILTPSPMQEQFKPEISEELKAKFKEYAKKLNKKQMADKIKAPNPPMIKDFPLSMNKYSLYKKLNLTQQQQDKIFDIEYKNIPIMRDYIKSLTQLYQKLNNAKYNKNFDDKLAHEIINEISKIQTLIQLNQFNTEKDIFNVLTPEQQQLFTKLNCQKQWKSIKKNDKKKLK